MKALTTRAAWLREDRRLKPIFIVVIKQFGTYLSQTVAQTFYLSDRPVIYDWDGQDRSFRPLIMSASPRIDTMNHLPEARSAKALSLTLLNRALDPGGDDLLKLMEQYPIEFATVEIAQVLISDAAGESPYDLRALAGSHTVFFRGCIEQMRSATAEQIVLDVGDCRPQLPWLIASDWQNPRIDPKDVGKRFPYPVGRARGVPLINWKVGWVTTLRESVGTEALLLRVTSVDPWSNGQTVRLRIGGEQLIGDVDRPNREIIISAISFRGIAGTQRSIHLAGEVIVEILNDDISGVGQHVFIIAPYPIKRVATFYIRNPFNGERFSLSEFVPDVDNADTTTLPGATLTTLRLTRGQLELIAKQMTESPSVTQQPEFQTDTIGTLPSDFAPRPATLDILEDTAQHVYTSEGFWDLTTPDAPIFRVVEASGITRKPLRATWTGGQSYPGSSRKIFRWRLSLQIEKTTADPPLKTQAFIWCEGIPGIPDGTVVLTNFVPGGVGATSSVFVSAWYSPPEGTIESNLAGAKLYIGSTATNFRKERGGMEFIAGAWGVEYQYESGGTNATRVQDAIIQGATVGFGIELFADIEGPFEITEQMVDDMEGDPASDWTGVGATLANEGTIVTQGAQSLKSTSDAAANATARGPSLGGADWSGFDRLVIELIPGTLNAFLDADNGILVELWSDGARTNGVQFQYGSDAISLGVPNTITIGLPVQPHTVFGTGLDLTNVEHLDLWHNTASTKNAGWNVYWDYIRLELDVLYDTGPRIVQHYLEQIATPAQTIDVANFALAEAALSPVASPTGLIFGGDLRNLGQSFEEVLGSLAFNTRSNIIPEEIQSGTVWRMFAASPPGSNWSFPAAARTLTDWDDFSQETRPFDMIFNRIAALYDFDPSRVPNAQGGEETFLLAHVATSNGNLHTLPSPGFAQVLQSENRHGIRVRNTMAFFLISQVPTADDIVGYYVQEFIRHPVRLFDLRGVPWWQAYDLERGDVVQVTPPWGSTPIKCRILEHIKDWQTERVSLRLVEVL